MRRLNNAFRLLVVAAFLLTCFAAAAAQEIRFKFLRGTDFSKYKTYKWVQVPNAQYPNQILDSQIKQAIDSQMALKGFTKTEDNPDLYICYQVAVNQEKEWNSFRAI